MEKNEEKKGGISGWQALIVSTATRVGTGNIIGVVSALLTGGPGAVVWMWVSAFFGMITNYAENVLGLYFRRKDESGDFSGGAFYYIKHGLGKGLRWLSYPAAIFCLFAALGMSGVQTNKITQTITEVVKPTAENSTMVSLIIGCVVAAVAALIILGGIKRIGKVASLMVPFMSLLFIVLAVVGIFMNITAVPAAFKLIFTNIFGFKALAGGVGGYLFTQVIQKGMARGVFSNEAGLGSSVIAHSASETREPVKQGLWGIFEVFFDTFIICTLTALVFLTTFIGNGLFESFFAVDASGQMSATVADASASIGAFSSNFGVFGTACFTIILPLFAFTTIMAWSYYGEKAVEFCFAPFKKVGQKIAVIVFKLIYLAMIVGAAVIESDILWNISDTANGLMAIPNLIAVVLLSGTVVKITKNYYDRKKGKDVEPMLSAYPEQNAEFAADLKDTDGE